MPLATCSYTARDQVHVRLIHVPWCPWKAATYQVNVQCTYMHMHVHVHSVYIHASWNHEFKSTHGYIPTCGSNTCACGYQVVNLMFWWQGHPLGRGWSQRMVVDYLLRFSRRANMLRSGLATWRRGRGHSSRTSRSPPPRSSIAWQSKSYHTFHASHWNKIYTSAVVKH